MRYEYPIILDEQPEGFTVSAQDVPGLHTEGDTSEEALVRTEDALVSALSFYVDDGRPLPAPSPADGRPVVSVPLLEATKLALHEAMIAAKVSNVELGRRMGTGETAIRRLRDPLHRSHVGQVEAALRMLGRRIVLEVAAA